MKFLFLFSSVIITLLSEIEVRAETKESLNSRMVFSIELYRTLSDPAKNIVLSPYSIYNSLNIAYLGADGNTEKQIAETLRISDDSYSNLEEVSDQVLTNNAGQDLELYIANQFYFQSNYPIKQSYKDKISRIFNLSPMSLDFESDPESSRILINDWVKSFTKNKILNLIPPNGIDILTRAILVNAIYFKAKWENQFPLKNTTIEEFHANTGLVKKSHFMHAEFTTPYFENDEVQILELPYSGQKFSMVLILPNKNQSLDLVHKNLDKLIVHSKHLQKLKVNIALPKFKQEYGTTLNNSLIKLGIIDAFNEKKANFSKIVDSKNLYISEVIHKAFLEIQEEGSEAAAATAVILRSKSLPTTPIPIFKADRPFFFLIKENTSQTILFLGNMVEP